MAPPRPAESDHALLHEYRLPVVEADCRKVAEADSAQTGWAKLVEWATALLGSEADDCCPILACCSRSIAPNLTPAVGSDSLGRPMFRAMRRMVHALAHRRPTIFALEDVHWLDQSSL